jgi:UDP-N-acetylglucosamine 2-epimerase
MECGVARLVGGDPKHLDKLLEEAYGDTAWVRSVQSVVNPFGEGNSGRRIAAAIKEFFTA